MTKKLMPDPDILFTYGTLRPGLGNSPEAQEFRATARHIGPARFQGKLYAIDWYPGVVDCPNPSSTVIGDIFEVGKNPDFFEKLDRYEGCSPEMQQPFEYVRTVRNVAHNGRGQRPSGSPRKARGNKKPGRERPGRLPKD